METQKQLHQEQIVSHSTDVSFQAAIAVLVHEKYCFDRCDLSSGRINAWKEGAMLGEADLRIAILPVGGKTNVLSNFKRTPHYASFIRKLENHLAA